MGRGLFVTGTDTGVGKSRIAVALIERLRGDGRPVAGFKPVAAGCERTAAGLRNDDALALQGAGAPLLPYERINPYAFAPAIAPHLAAAAAGVEMTVAELLEHYRALEAEVGRVVVEGAGGWLVPLNRHENLADLAVALDLPVVLVVAIRLGCLNHALLTVEAIRARGLPLHGWIANLVDGETPCHRENVQTLAERLDARLLGTVPHLGPGRSAAPYLTV
ncbi:dethiobiotin synthase [Endothiovibrio diazotrophicus]